MSANIRYVSIVLDHGGYVPHSSDSILAARYGDCKDHVTLLEALLATKKICGSAALVQATNSYVVPKTVVIGAFNHAITYLPDFDLFVDSTPGSLPFGILTPNEAGKQALIVDNGRGKSELRRLPTPTVRGDWAASRWISRSVKMARSPAPRAASRRDYTKPRTGKRSSPFPGSIAAVRQPHAGRARHGHDRSG